MERALLGPGLPNRPWYRHTVSAPGVLTGYGAKTLPGVREAIEGRRWKEAEAQARVAAEALDRASAILERRRAVRANRHFSGWRRFGRGHGAHLDPVKVGR